MPNLYVTEPGSVVEREAGRIIVTKADEVLLAVPATLVESVVMVGGVTITSPALHLLLERGSGALLISSGGRFLGRLSGDLSKNVALRRVQYRRADDTSFCLRLARAIVEGKIRNSRTLCMRMSAGDQRGDPTGAAYRLQEILGRVVDAPNVDELLGLEGQGTWLYFTVVRKRVHHPWTFERRARRPPPDPVNSLFSLLYTLLHESCHTAVEAAGLDPYCGYFHQERYGRPSLALDLMEEFRPVVADSVALTLLNKRMLGPDNFAPGRDGEGIYLNSEGWRKVARQYTHRLHTLVRLPGTDRRLTYQKVLEVQARRLRSVIEGEAERYEPFLVK